MFSLTRASTRVSRSPCQLLLSHLPRQRLDGLGYRLERWASRQTIRVIWRPLFGAEDSCGATGSSGVETRDVRYAGLFHLHQDHTGNVGMFPGSVLLIGEQDLASARSSPPPFGVDPSFVSLLSSAKIQPVKGDLDVFGDGAVTILTMPGHTPVRRVNDRAQTMLRWIASPASGPMKRPGWSFSTTSGLRRDAGFPPNF